MPIVLEGILQLHIIGWHSFSVSSIHEWSPFAEGLLWTSPFLSCSERIRDVAHLCPGFEWIIILLIFNLLRDLRLLLERVRVTPLWSYRGSRLNRAFAKTLTIWVLWWKRVTTFGLVIFVLALPLRNSLDLGRKGIILLSFKGVILTHIKRILNFTDLSYTCLKRITELTSIHRIILINILTLNSKWIRDFWSFRSYWLSESIYCLSNLLGVLKSIESLPIILEDLLFFLLIIRLIKSR